MRTFFFIVLAIGSLGWLSYNLDLGMVVQNLTNANPVFLLGMVIVYFLLCLVRSLRWKSVPIFSEMGHGTLFGVTGLHSFWNNILPARTGEVSFSFLLKKHSGINIGHSAGILMMVRIYDAFATVSTMLFLLPWIYVLQYGGNEFNLQNTSYLILIIIFLLLVIINGEKILKNLLRFFDTSFPNFRVKKTILAVAEDFNYGMVQISGLKVRLKIFVLTVVCNFLTYLIFYFAFKSLGINVTLIALLIGSTFTLLGSLLPINAPGNIGAFDAGWIGGFLLTGLTKHDAVASCFIMHSMVLISALLAGALSYAVLNFRKGGVNHKSIID